MPCQRRVLQSGRAAQKFGDENKALKQALEEKNSVIAKYEAELAELKRQLSQTQK